MGLNLHIICEYNDCVYLVMATNWVTQLTRVVFVTCAAFVSNYETIPQMIWSLCVFSWLQPTSTVIGLDF